MGGVLVDPCDRLVHALYDPDRELHGKELGVEVLVRRVLHLRHKGARLRVPHQLDLLLGERREQFRKVFLSECPVHDEALAGVADARALRLGIVQNALRHR